MAKKFKKNDVVKVIQCRYKDSWGIVVGCHRADLGGPNGKLSHLYDVSMLELHDESPELDHWPDISFLARELIKISVDNEMVNNKIITTNILQGKYR